MIAPIKCPVCQQWDRIEKVSTIVQAGSATGTFTGSSLNVGAVGGHLAISRGIVGLTGTQNTWLSSSLMPPVHPSAITPQRGGWWVFGIVMCSIFAGITLFGGLLYALVLITEIEVASQSSANETAGSKIPTSSLFPSFLLLLLLLSVFIGLLIFCIIRKRRTDKARLATIAAQEPRWQQAMQCWYTLYYCYRDDVVFIPDILDAYASPQMISQLL